MSKIIHCPGTQNGAADALSQSRYLPSIEQSCVSLPIAAVKHSCPPPVNLCTFQREDVDRSAIIAYRETATLPDNDAKA